MIRLIETVRIRDGSAPLWYLHLRRLATSCKALGIPLPGELLTPAGGPDRVHRLEVGRAGVEITERPLGGLASVRLVTSSVPHRPYPHKTTDRGQFDRALTVARASGADDALLLTPGGAYLAECAVWALFWWEDGRVCTPALELGILPSVARARVAELAGGGGLRERRVGVDGVRGRALFLGNAARGLVPVASLDREEVPEAAETSVLARRFWA
ncbi:MAG: aminotransferase class IV [Gemmatimonadales bacterium]